MKDSIALDAHLITKCDVDTKSSKILSYPEFQNHQVISPYISSTFDDFEEEFKHLHTDVFPKLNEYCQKRGARFVPVDFRRTVVESRFSSDFALSHALDSIKQCCPFFMAIFGQKYGPHRLPTDSFLNAPAPFGRYIQNAPSNLDQNLLTAGKLGHSWVLEKKWQLCSLMELEIQAAALEQTSTAKYCFFYIRDFKHSYLKKTDKSFNATSYTASEISIESRQSGDELAMFEAESEYAEKRLNELKMRIVKKGWTIKFFSNPTELGHAVLHNWMKVINQIYPTLPNQNEFLHEDWSIQSTRQELEEKYYWNDDLKRVSKSMNQHVATSALNENIDKDALIMNTDDEAYIKAPKYGDGLFSTTKSFIEAAQSLRYPETERADNMRKDIFVVVGDPGSGKSALIAQWLKQFEETQRDVLVISEFIGASHVSRDIGSFLRRCVKTIREIRGNKRMTYSECLEDTKSYSSLVSAFQECIKLIPCILIIDSLNDLKASMNEDIGSIKRLSWLPDKIPSTCRIILSTRRSDLTYKSLTERKDVSINWIPILSKPDRIKILKTHLTRHSLNIGTINSEKITGNRLSEKPLYLSTLAGLISSCTKQQEVNQVIERCTELRTFRDFWKATFNLWTRRFSWTKGSQGQPGSCRTRNTVAGWIGDSLRLIGSSRNGLLPSEILHVLSLLGYRGKTAVKPYDWMVFQKAAGNAFSTRPEGTVMLAHTEVRHAIKFFLLGAILPTATASAASMGSVNLQQHYHSLLSSYFLKYGSQQRKLIELPWQLEQGGDHILLYQVLSKPRYFESICKATEDYPYLDMDLIRYWKKLNKVGFNPPHYLQMMVEKSTGCYESGLMSKRSSLIPGAQNWQASKLSITAPRTTRAASIVSSVSPLKRPSIIIITQHDDVRRQSTIGSRSETGDFDMSSEAGSCSFFITESEGEIFNSGWTPAEDDPEIPIDESTMDNDESCELNYNVCMFLKQLGNEFIQESKDGLLSLSQQFLEIKPLSGKQQIIQFKTLCSLAMMTNDEISDNLHFARCLFEEGLEIYESISTNVSSATFSHDLFDLKISACLHLAQMCIDNGNYENAENLLKESVDASQQYQSSTQETNVVFMCAKLFVAQGLYPHAETLFKRVFTERLQWYGPAHISVAIVLCELGDLYSISSKQGQNEGQRISLLAYKQALHIFQHNSAKDSEASVLHKIGKLLKMEGSLCSTQEAKECLEHAMDMYMTQTNTQHTNDIPEISNDIRKLSINLKRGQYKYGSAKPPDERTYDRPYSTLSWHEHDLKKILKNRPCTAPADLEKNTKYGKQSSFRAISGGTSRPYSAFSTASYGKRVAVTPKENTRKKPSSALLKHLSEIPSSILSEGKSLAAQDKGKAKDSTHGLTYDSGDHLALKPDVTIHGGWINQADDDNHLDLDHHDVVTFKEDDTNEIPVMIIPAGRQSRLSVKLEVDTLSGKSMPISSLKRHSQRSYKARSEFSFRSGDSMMMKSVLQIRHNAHKKHCHIPSGPNALSLAVHGSHSTIETILPPPKSSRQNVASSGLSHKTAWYNVPGRYPMPGHVLPSKHKQIRPGSAFTSNSNKV
ncbi:uncharacterized protein LOC120339237 [Styela clava]